VVHDHILMYQSDHATEPAPAMGSEVDIAEIYEELRIMARGRLAAEFRMNTLSTTGLVHEAWLRLEKSSPERWRDRPQFFAAASEAMRRILIEAARKRLAAKRGGGQIPVSIDEVDIPDRMDDERLLAVNEALERLEREDPERAQVVKLRFFSGMENEEIAALLGVNEKTVRRHWAVAKVWLYRFLQNP
jgi:RNA polymerase sigma factor (TIGR02999 family)